MTPIISAADLNLLLGNPNLLIIDCRHDLFDPAAGEEAWRAASLPGAAFLHLDRDLSGPVGPGDGGRHPLPPVAAFRERLAALGLQPDTFVVAYDDKGGGIAARLWWMLRSLGHARVAILDGGFPAWCAEGLRTSEGKKVRPVRTADLSHLATTTFAGTCDRAHIATLVATPGALVDARTAPRYRGEQEPIDPVAGHIPGAINLPWPDNLADGLLKNRQALTARFAELFRAQPPVFYCGSGVTACHNLLAAYHATGKMGLLYPGGWSEYLKHDAPHPIA